jgi:hypothetical protein
MPNWPPDPCNKSKFAAQVVFFHQKTRFLLAKHGAPPIFTAPSRAARQPGKIEGTQAADLSKAPFLL